MELKASLCAVLLVAGASGCASTTVPWWAMHVPRAHVDRSARTERLEQRLVGELQSARYRTSFTSPEQIAALAVHELQAGNPWDAAVLLALASYRRHQQAEYARDYGLHAGMTLAMDKSNGYLDAAKYGEYVAHEAEVFHDATFDEELDRVAAQVGGALSQESLAEDVRRVAMGNLYDRYSAEQTIAQRFEANSAPQPERLAHPALASALCEHLIAASQEQEHNWVAVHYLANVPLRAFRESALASVRARFDGSVVRAGQRLYATDPAAVLEALRSPQAPTRAHAAVILGAAGDLTRLPDLEQALEHERSSPVRDALEYALLQLGEQQYLPRLIESAELSNPATVQHVVTLLQWLPYDVEAQVPERVLVKVVRDDDSTPLARAVAAMTLHDIATTRPLEDDSIDAMFEGVQALAEIPVAVQRMSRAIADLEQLDHGRTVAAVRSEQLPREPWLARLGVIGQSQDLPLLDRLMAKQPGPGVRAALVFTVVAIAGPQAQALLERWYAQMPELRRVIAIQLVLRTDVDKARLARLSAELPAEPASALLDLALGRPDVAARLHQQLRGDDPDTRYTAALAVKLFGGPEFRESLWFNVGYTNDEFYPDDVKLRQLALSALLDLGLNRSRAAAASTSTGAEPRKPFN